MNAIIFSSQEEVNSFSSQVNAVLGYPKKGFIYNGGKHPACICPPDGINPECENVTYTYSTEFKHPTLNLWAYEVDAGVPQDLLTNKTVEILTNDWFN